MKQYISESYFVDQIVGDEYNSMSSEGANALFHYLEQHEDECSFEIEFDRVAIRCEWTEYTNIEEVLKEYDNINTLEDLRDHTIVIEVPNTNILIIQEF